MRVIGWIAVVIAVLVFVFFYSKSEKEETWSRKSDSMANTITRVIADKLYNERELHIMGTGGGLGKRFIS